MQNLRQDVLYMQVLLSRPGLLLTLMPLERLQGKPKAGAKKVPLQSKGQTK
jgi:hypothetical protein